MVRMVAKKTATEPPTPIRTTVVRRASAAHRTTTMVGYIGKLRFGWVGSESRVFCLERGQRQKDGRLVVVVVVVVVGL
ncbi:hypothetical protein L195_g058318 [Trifolium pratense]|uniref:Uncharacterized protein n=1 Tax=Trifolium pratense TaxID=57577 RepID=A0A2K3JRJ7_TRIPR|nr:hypothetical protein L195_g058318 [Trifolium pratense]